MSRSAAVASAPKKAASAAATESEARAGRVFDGGLIAVFLGLTFLLGVFPLKDTDFWWHLRTGDWIRQTGWVPTVDLFTFGAAGHAWVDLHWVFQLLMSWGFERVGVVGLNLAKCGVTCAAVWLLITSGRREWPVWVTLLAWIPALLTLGGRMYLRPETLTLLYLALDIAILARWERRPWLAFALPIVQVCWVNTQGLFVFGPFLVAVALLDAATRRGAFRPERRAWWRIALGASAATVLACLLNPYGLRGAVYPFELLGTMSNPIFKRSIGELKPLPTLFAEVGFDLLPLQLHMVTMALGALSFVVPATWRVVTSWQDRPGAAPDPPAKQTTKASRQPRRSSPVAVSADAGRPLRWFRWILFLTFSGLSLAASRNSHQFAAVVGTITGWNLAEWAAEVSARLRRRSPALAADAPRVWPRVVSLGVLVAALGAVGSGRFHVWSAEGRTIGLGEEPFWFPHAAVKFAGSRGMPDRLVGFHNGHPSLYEYYWGPGKQVYTDARLEVMGPDLYQEYMTLGSKISGNVAGWTDDLDKLNHPAVLLDTVDPGNGRMVASLLAARRWHCVWFDPIAAVFVDATYPRIVQEHEVDFLRWHYAGKPEADNADAATCLAAARSLRGVAMAFPFRGGDPRARPLIWLALDYARRLRSLDPSGLDGWKQAGLLTFLLDTLPDDAVIPRFRLAFDPTIDLDLVTASYQLRQALAVVPDEGVCAFYLALLDTKRGMDESAIPLLDQFARQPNKNLEQQRQKARTVDQLAEIRRRLGSEPTTKWNNLSELEQVYDRLTRSGWVVTAAAVIAAAHRDAARPWAWADRLATIRLHLGQPARARAVWQAAADAPPALQSARIAATYLVEGDLEAARKAYGAALASDPNLFEAAFGLARLEQGAGRAAEAVAAARLAAQVATTERLRRLARAIATEAAAYRSAGPGAGTPATP